MHFLKVRHEDLTLWANTDTMWCKKSRETREKNGKRKKMIEKNRNPGIIVSQCSFHIRELILNLTFNRLLYSTSFCLSKIICSLLKITKNSNLLWWKLAGFIHIVSQRFGDGNKRINCPSTTSNCTILYFGRGELCY